MQIIDTHLHLIELDRLRYPWLDREPALKRNFALDDYLSEAIPAGIKSMLHMEVDVAEPDQDRETAWVAGIDDRVVGVIAGCRPENATFPSQLERLVANPKVRGLRRTFHASIDTLSQRPLVVENIKRLAAAELTYDLCALPHQLPQMARLASQAPDVQFVLDHCGIPNVRAQESEPWRSDVKALASLPNVACKISGIIAHGDPKHWTADDLRPFVEHVIEVFGWSRVVWGSDWPVCNLTASLTRWVEVTHLLLTGASESEKASLLNGNAKRIYRLPLDAMRAS